MTLDQRDQKAGAQQIHVEGGSRGDDFVSVGRDRKRPLDVVEHIEAGLALCEGELARVCADRDRKSTRLNSSHSQISYAVFWLKKKKRPSPLVFLPLSTHSTATPGIPSAYTVLEHASLTGSHVGETRDFTVQLTVHPLILSAQ